MTVFKLGGVQVILYDSEPSSVILFTFLSSIQSERIESMNPYLAILILFAVSGAITALMYSFSVFFGPKNMKHPDKSLPFECGSKPIGDARFRYPVKFYIVAVIFVVFDIEVVFLYPWAVKFRELGMFGLVEMAVFIGILTVGLIYVWKKGVFEWR